MPDTPPPITPAFTGAPVPPEPDVFDDGPDPEDGTGEPPTAQELRQRDEDRLERQVGWLRTVNDLVFRARVEEYVWNSAGPLPGLTMDARMAGRIQYMQTALAHPDVVERAVAALTTIIGDTTRLLEAERDALAGQERNEAERRRFNGRKRMLRLASTVRAALNPIAGEVRDRRRRAEAETPEKIATAQLIEAHKDEYAKLVIAARRKRKGPSSATR